ncbi:MAG: hypothetical protein N5P05_002766 [Chroococcopsis gigantea SAG 12.99]|jgi:uncharacterized protein (DUF362 family)|nr:hypothetical protein [Chroococcopsis gigantea SAG 12.99]
MSTVSLLRAENYEPQALLNNLENLLEPLGGMATIVKPGDKVLLKPNLLTGSRPDAECVTRPELVYCVALLVQRVGGKPFMGDSPAFGSALGVAKANGYLPWLEKLNLPVIEFTGQKYQTVGDSFNHLRLSKQAMDADVVINLPKVKSHVQLTLTLGVKNLFGCVPGKMKAWWHMEAGKSTSRFGEMLVETAKAIDPDLTIIDGIIGHEGNGPSGGQPRELGVLAASRDVFAIDRAMVSLLGGDDLSIPTIEAQNRLGYGKSLDEMGFPLCTPGELGIDDWCYPENLMPIDFGLPRVVRSTFKHLYIQFIKERLQSYSVK